MILDVWDFTQDKSVQDCQVTKWSGMMSFIKGRRTVSLSRWRPASSIKFSWNLIFGIIKNFLKLENKKSSNLEIQKCPRWDGKEYRMEWKRLHCVRWNRFVIALWKKSRRKEDGFWTVLRKNVKQHWSKSRNIFSWNVHHNSHLGIQKISIMNSVQSKSEKHFEIFLWEIYFATSSPFQDYSVYNSYKLVI